MTRLAIINVDDAFKPREEQERELVAIWEDGETLWGEPIGAQRYDDPEMVRKSFDGPGMFAVDPEDAGVEMPPEEDLDGNLEQIG